MVTPQIRLRVCMIWQQKMVPCPAVYVLSDSLLHLYTVLAKSTSLWFAECQARIINHR